MSPEKKKNEEAPSKKDGVTSALGEGEKEEKEKKKKEKGALGKKGKKEDTPPNLKMTMVLFLIASFVIIFIVRPMVLSPASEEQLSSLSKGPAHTSELRSNLDGRNVTIEGKNVEFKTTHVIGTPRVLEGIADRNNTLFFVVGVEKRYSEVEAESIIQFVEGGGNVIIADDTGLANSVSRPLGVSFYGQQFWDSQVQNHSDFPIINANLSGREYRLLSNKPTCLQVLVKDKKDVNYIANSTPKAFCDVNPNGIIDIYDLDAFTRPIALIVEIWVNENGEPVSKEEMEPGKTYGHAVFVSDPGIFTNFALDFDYDGDGNPDLDNLDFSLDLVDYMLPRGGTIIFDESRHIRKGPEESLGSTIGFLGIITAPTPVGIAFGPIKFPFLPGFFSMGVVFVFLLSFSRKMRDKDSWVHMFNLEGVKFDDTIPTANEILTETLRNLIFEKARLSKSLSREEAEAVGKEELVSQMGDKELLDFYKSTKGAAESQLEHIANKLSEWKGE